MIFLIFITFLTFTLTSVTLTGITGMLIYFFPSLKARSYRVIFLHITYVTSFSVGIMISWTIVNGLTPLQLYFLITGALIIFFLSPFFLTIRRNTYHVATIWCLICLFWLFMAPIPLIN